MKQRKKKPMTLEQANKLLNDKYKGLAEDKIRNNDSVYEKNEKLLVDKNKKLEKARKYMDINLKMLHCQINGLKVVDPKFEFEKTQEWQTLQKEFKELELETAIESQKNTLEEMEEDIKRIERQQVSILNENDGLRVKIDEIEQGLIQASDQEIEDLLNSPDVNP